MSSTTAAKKGKAKTVESSKCDPLEFIKKSDIYGSTF